MVGPLDGRQYQVLRTEGGRQAGHLGELACVMNAGPCHAAAAVAAATEGSRCMAGNGCCCWGTAGICPAGGEGGVHAGVAASRSMLVQSSKHVRACMRAAGRRSETKNRNAREHMITHDSPTLLGS